MCLVSLTARSQLVVDRRRLWKRLKVRREGGTEIETERAMGKRHEVRWRVGWHRIRRQQHDLLSCTL